MIKLKKLATVFFSCLTVLSLLATSGCTLFNPGAGTDTPTTAAAVSGNGTLTLYNIDPYTLDPATSSEATSHEYIMQLYSGLVMLDGDLNPVADIAEKWDVTNNGTVYTFTLKPGVKFHDGRAVTAADFKYSWERACLPATASLTAGTYLGDIVGVKDVLAGKANTISGVKAINDTTLEVTIEAPHPYFLYKLAYVTAYVVDKNNVAKGGEWWRKPNGTGPFKLKTWTEGSSFVLERNTLYYGEMAKIKTVDFKLWAGVPMRLYETGDIDITGVDESYLDAVTDDAGPYAKQLTVLPELSFNYVAFNCTKPPFDDANIRQAFTLAIDRKKLASLLFKDMVAPASGILPPGMPGYNESLKGLDFNVEQAKELIKASKYGDVANLPPITMTVTGYGVSVSSGVEALVYEWQQTLGVTVNIRQIEPERFFYFLKQEKDEMYMSGWVADYPHPQDFLEILFRTGQDNNYGEYSNTAVDALLDKAGLEPDNAASLQMYRQAEQMLVDDAACLPLWFGKSYVLVKPYVSGYDPTPMGFAKLNKVAVNK